MANVAALHFTVAVAPLQCIVGVAVAPATFRACSGETERIQSNIQNRESIENEKENVKKFRTFCRKSFKDSKTVFVFILA